MVKRKSKEIERVGKQDVSFFIPVFFSGSRFASKPTCPICTRPLRRTWHTTWTQSVLDSRSFTLLM